MGIKRSAKCKVLNFWVTYKVMHIFEIGANFCFFLHPLRSNKVETMQHIKNALNKLALVFQWEPKIT
jgi:hypothetical protein